MRQNLVTCPNCGTNGVNLTSRLRMLYAVVLVISILFTILCAISLIGLIFLVPIFPFIVGVNILTYVLSNIIKEDLKCTCTNCKNVWVIKNGKKTWF